EAEIGGKLDLDAVSLKSHFKIDAPQSGVTPQDADLAHDGARSVLDDIDIVRPQEQLRRTVGHVARGKVELMPVEPHFALLDIYREHARFPDERKHEGRVRRVIDFIRRADLL